MTGGLRTRGRRGVLLVLVLILSATLFILAAGFLSAKTRERKTARLAQDAFQAQQIAFSGLEAVRVKLLNDYNFPPSTLSPTQELFRYSEYVYGFDGDRVLGSYQVECDRRWMEPPYLLLRVSVIGQVGDEEAHLVRHRIQAEFSLADGQKGDLVSLLDLGSY